MAANDFKNAGNRSIRLLDGDTPANTLTLLGVEDGGVGEGIAGGDLGRVDALHHLLHRQLEAFAGQAAGHAGHLDDLVRDVAG